MSGFPGVCIRIQARLKALGYSKNGRPDILRFCQERAYRPQYLYAWLRGRLPAWEHLVRLPPDPRAPLPALPFWPGAGGTFLPYQAGRSSSFHVPPETVVGKRLGDAFPPELAPTLESAARDALAAPGPAPVEFT